MNEVLWAGVRGKFLNSSVRLEWAVNLTRGKGIPMSDFIHLPARKSMDYPQDLRRLQRVAQSWDPVTVLLKLPAQRRLFLSTALVTALPFLGMHVCFMGNHLVLGWYLFGFGCAVMLLGLWISTRWSHRYLRYHYPQFARDLPAWWEFDWCGRTWRDAVRTWRLDRMRDVCGGSDARLALVEAEIKELRDQQTLAVRLEAIPIGLYVTILFMMIGFAPGVITVTQSPTPEKVSNACALIAGVSIVITFGRFVMVGSLRSQRQRLQQLVTDIRHIRAALALPVSSPSGVTEHPAARAA